MSTPPRRVAVFDLDDTLVRGDSFALFMRHLLFRQRWRAALAVLSAPVLWPMLFVPASRRIAIGGMLWIASAGLSEAEFTGLARRFATAHADRRIRPALDRLRQHLDAGDRVVIVTACADPLASAVCAELGLPDVEIIAARLQHGRAGMRPALGCRGAQKVDRLRDAGISLPVDYAYTDSAVDLPLLKVATHRYLIEPSTRHRDRIRAVLPDNVTVLDTTTTP
ncbi:HAD-IB family phosphatase [Plantactinospora sp. S1510]|uniref:HAD-IB family phosphatase n=1 Tax=Plantactinospora alkalitolerans TaxID=2789879 RepID=A0ABS0H3F5_9ACTN|nr:HAD-IB family phosphatase [Plantactinospora alkalitolerans]MBF9132993.1 HAD-IB family phosphatase [Plantactinospora alkalitolerans]